MTETSHQPTPLTESLVTCFYCGFEKPRSEFSDEHIWPDALGGDYLSAFWRTDDVCGRCNSMSGVWVDGAFIRSWAGSRERGSDARIYGSPTEPLKTILPLDYLGMLPDPAIPVGHVADWWVGPCGATIIHFRPEEPSGLWESYLGGDPRAKKAAAGRAYIAFASGVEYWIVAALGSFKKHFKRAKRYVVTPGLPPSWADFNAIDRSDPVQAADLVIIDGILARARAGQSTPARMMLNIGPKDPSLRWLCKLALAIGCNLFGAAFGDHGDGALLRRAFREADPEKRKAHKVRGTGYLSGADSPLNILAWPAGWVLMVQVLNGTLNLAVITPARHVMAIVITDDPVLTSQVPSDLAAGQVWIAVPPAARAVGPIALPDYIAHISRAVLNPDLSAIEALQIDPAALPAC